jgi:hypothetical protein
MLLFAFGSSFEKGRHASGFGFLPAKWSMDSPFIRLEECSVTLFA